MEHEDVIYSVRKGRFRARHTDCVRKVKQIKNPVIGRYVGCDMGSDGDELAIVELTTPPSTGTLPISFEAFSKYYLQKPLKTVINEKGTIGCFTTPCVSPCIKSPTWNDWKSLHLVPNPYDFEQEYNCTFISEGPNRIETGKKYTIDVPESSNIKMLDLYDWMFKVSEPEHIVERGLEFYEIDEDIDTKTVEQARNDYMKALRRYRKKLDKHGIHH